MLQVQIHAVEKHVFKTLEKVSDLIIVSIM